MPAVGAIHSRGSTLIEVVLAITIGTLLIISLGRVVTSALASSDDARVRNELSRDARFAIQRITQSVQNTHRLMVPIAEAVEFDPGVLAVTMDPTLDRDLNGVADADNDGDGRVDEDPGGDVTNDYASGIVGIDDDGDGDIDEPHGGGGPAEDDDDEDDTPNEDSWNKDDDDEDDLEDEDPAADASGDGAAGLIGVDDDGDGLVDEGDITDDDEDGLQDEDWLDVIVYFVSGTQLIERFPNLNPIDGTQFTERVIADNVSGFTVERLALGNNRLDLVKVTLTLEVGNQTVGFEQSIRVGALQ